MRFSARTLRVRYATLLTHTHGEARTETYTNVSYHTRTALSIAGLGDITTARLAAVCGRGITASASVHATTTSNGAFIVPFAPVPIEYITVVIEIAPVARATWRQAERVNAGESTSL